MKRIVLLLCILHCFTFVYAQIEAPVQTATTTIPNKDAKFLLFPTKNIHIFLKLNTRNGEVSIVQYSLDGKEGEVKIHSYYYPLVSKEEQSNGRFYLYPTTNIYNFLLMDQIDGRVWQVQWDFEGKNRMLNRIYDDRKSWASSDSILLKDLDYQDYIYYKDDEMFNGIAYLDNDYTVAIDFHDGRESPLYPYCCYHKNGKLAFVFDKDELKDFSSHNVFNDEEGNRISREEFKEKYPELLSKVKQIMGIGNNVTKTQIKKPTPPNGTKK